MGDFVINVADDCCESVLSGFCRICHETEFESSKSLEAPCGCSGTLKLVHRDCIQRWCNEKGNTICEICLQKFEAGYTAPAAPTKIHPVDTPPVTTRGSGNPRRETDEGNARDEKCSLDTCASSCRKIVFILALLLLMLHIFELLAGEATRHPFSLSTVVIIKIGGIVVPAYVLIGIITLINNAIRQQHLDFVDTIRRSTPTAHPI